MSASGLHSAKEWLTWRGGSDNRFALKADFFIEALRLRLLVAPFFNPEMRSCSMCHGVLIRDSPLHCLDCNALTPWRNRRHDMVRDYLAEVIKSHARLEPGTTVETEVTIQGTGPRGARTSSCVGVRSPS